MNPLFNFLRPHGYELGQPPVRHKDLRSSKTGV